MKEKEKPLDDIVKVREVKTSTSVLVDLRDVFALYHLLDQEQARTYKLIAKLSEHDIVNRAQLSNDLDHYSNLKHRLRSALLELT